MEVSTTLEQQVALPFRASVSGNANLTPTDDPCILRNEETGAGTATTLGTFQWRDVEAVDFCAIPGGVAVVASFVMTAANGDELAGELTTTGTFAANGDLIIEGTYVLAGGSGRFANATGIGTVSVVARMAPGLPFDGMLVGTITSEHAPRGVGRSTGAVIRHGIAVTHSGIVRTSDCVGLRPSGVILRGSSQRTSTT